MLCASGGCISGFCSSQFFFPSLYCVVGIRQLQLMLLKMALLLGIEIHVNVEFKGLIEPPEDQETESKWVKLPTSQTSWRKMNGNWTCVSLENYLSEALSWLCWGISVWLHMFFRRDRLEGWGPPQDTPCQWAGVWCHHWSGRKEKHATRQVHMHWLGEMHE